MTIRNLALISNSKSVTLPDIHEMAAALQKQIIRDLSPIWSIQATISAFGDLKSVPVGYWPIIIKDNIGQPGAGGFHSAKNNQPFALIESGSDWRIATSHEMCEMLVDPSGNTCVTGDSLKPGQGRVQYLLEACDPCEGGEFSYSINGIAVSDFITPHFHDPVKSSGVRYSFTGSVTKPMEILAEGYISWYEPVSQTMWQAFKQGKGLKFKNLGSLPGGFSLREFVDSHTKMKPYSSTLGKNKILGNTDPKVRNKSSESAGNIWEEAIRKVGA